MSIYDPYCNILFMTVIDLSKPYDDTLPFTSEMWLKVKKKFISVINKSSFNTFKLNSFDGMIYHNLINIYRNGSYFFLFIPRVSISKFYNNHNIICMHCNGIDWCHGIYKSQIVYVQRHFCSEDFEKKRQTMRRAISNVLFLLI